MSTFLPVVFYPLKLSSPVTRTDHIHGSLGRGFGGELLNIARQRKQRIGSTANRENVSMTQHLFRILVGCMAALTAVLIVVERRGQVVSDWVLRGSSLPGRAGCRCQGGNDGSSSKSNSEVNDRRPPLSALIDYTTSGNNTIKGNVEFLLDFAIVGRKFPYSVLLFVVSCARVCVFHMAERLHSTN